MHATLRSIALVSLAALAFAAAPQSAADARIETNIAYYPDSVRAEDSYIASRGVLDVYCPIEDGRLPVVVWFHGGGIRAGYKQVPAALKDSGVCVVAPNYRLSPRVEAPAYIEDAAAAVAWTFDNIADFGGEPSLVFVSGHSAGGYLASMVGLDKRWLAAHDVDANRIAGLIPFSGHTITHFTVRQERGIPREKPIIDEFAPLFHVRRDAPPLLLITGDRERELLGRYEENAYLMRMMKIAGHQETQLFELDGYGHSMAEPAFPLLLHEVQRVTRLRTGGQP